MNGLFLLAWLVITAGTTFLAYRAGWANGFHDGRRALEAEIQTKWLVLVPSLGAFDRLKIKVYRDRRYIETGTGRLSEIQPD